MALLNKGFEVTNARINTCVDFQKLENDNSLLLNIKGPFRAFVNGALRLVNTFARKIC